MKQDLNHLGALSSTTFFGIGRTSQPNDYNPFERAAIYVFNQEVSHHFAKHWKYSLALSYRWQKRYQAILPYDLDSPAARQEIRIYSRYSYVTQFRKVDFSAIIRPEMRLFYNPNFSHYDEVAQFRTRFSGKIAINVNPSKTHKIIAKSEFLLATSKLNSWSKWGYKETRLSLFYSMTFPKQKVTLDVGYMNELIGKDFTRDVHYLAFDVILQNPFNR